MRLAFSTLGCPGWSFERAVEAAQQYGYQGLELRVIDGEVIQAPLEPAQLERIRRGAGQAGISIVGLGSSARLSSPDPKERQKNEQILIDFLGLARQLECPRVRVFGGNLPAGVPVEEVYDYMADSLRRLAQAARSAGGRIALETHDDFSTGYAVAQVLKRVPAPEIGAIWDAHHPYRMGESPQETARYLNGRILHVHIKDARRTDGGWQLVLLGQGEVPVRQMLAELKRLGYQGWYCAEWEKKWHPEIEEPEVALPQHAEVLRAWLARENV